jgi:hypothetical protein
MQKEIEGMRAQMNMNINEMIAAINTLKIEHQTRTFVRNQPTVERQVKTDEARGTAIKKSKETTEEKTRTQDSDTQRSNKQTEINNEDREGGQEESTAQISQSKETEDEMEQHTETQVENSPPAMTRGRWRNKEDLKK